MPTDPTQRSIDKYIAQREQSSPTRFTRLSANRDNVPKGTTGFFYTDPYPLTKDRKEQLHLFIPYEPEKPKKWIDKYGTQLIALVRKEDVE